jgi:hypothetical protein
VVEFREGVVVFGTIGVGLAVDDVVQYMSSTSESMST